MSAHESFNRSEFSQLVNSRGGRVFRLLAGTAFLVVGWIFRGHPAGVAAIAWSFFPLSAAIFDVCWVSAALGGPLSGEKIRCLRA